jgi:hypothetical protein
MSTWRRCVALAACIILAICSAGCVSDLGDIGPARSIPVKTGEFEGVILLSGDWVPAVDEILALEEQLITYLPQQQRAFDGLQAPIVERLPAYTRQYWGVLENEKRLIVANFFCDASRYDWHRREVSVLDGGDCYFRLRYDVEADTFSDLLVNGSA